MARKGTKHQAHQSNTRLSLELEQLCCRRYWIRMLMMIRCVGWSLWRRASWRVVKKVCYARSFCFYLICSFGLVLSTRGIVRYRLQHCGTIHGSVLPLFGSRIWWLKFIPFSHEKIPNLGFVLKFQSPKHPQSHAFPELAFPTQAIGQPKIQVGQKWCNSRRRVWTLNCYLNFPYI